MQRSGERSLASNSAESHNKTANQLCTNYLGIRAALIVAGYGSEISWQAGLSPSSFRERDFLKQSAWVILNSGMRTSVIEGLFDEFSSAFLYWQSASLIIDDYKKCREDALQVFGHAGKVDSIIEIARTVKEEGFDDLKEAILRAGADYFVRFPYVGPVTSRHLAKNLGFPVAKPDRHLKRIAEMTGFQSTSLMCEYLATKTGDSPQVVDIVLWRFATVYKDYGRVITGSIDWGWVDSRLQVEYSSGIDTSHGLQELVRN